MSIREIAYLYRIYYKQNNKRIPWKNVWLMPKNELIEYLRYTIEKRMNDEILDLNCIAKGIDVTFYDLYMNLLYDFIPSLRRNNMI